MAYHYNTRARARSDVEPDDMSSGDLDVEMTTAIASESTIVGSRVESVEGLESQPTEVAGSVTTHPQFLPEGGHSFVGGHGSSGSVSSSSMGVTLGYPSGHPDPHSSIMASVVESQSTASSAAIGISTATTATDLPPTGLLARQPPIGIETAAATNPTLVMELRFKPTFKGTPCTAMYCRKSLDGGRDFTPYLSILLLWFEICST